VKIAIPIYDRFTALDAVGPYEVLSRLPGATVHFVAAEPGPRRTETGMLALTADLALDQLTDPAVVVVPGGYGTRALAKDEQLLAWSPACSTGSRRRLTGSRSMTSPRTARCPSSAGSWSILRPGS